MIGLLVLLREDVHIECVDFNYRESDVVEIIRLLEGLIRDRRDTNGDLQLDNRDGLGHQPHAYVGDLVLGDIATLSDCPSSSRPSTMSDHENSLSEDHLVAIWNLKLVRLRLLNFVLSIRQLHSHSSRGG